MESKGGWWVQVNLASSFLWGSLRKWLIESLTLFRSAKSSTQLTSSPHFRWRQGPRLVCSSRKHRRLAALEGATAAARELRRSDVATICCSGLEEVAEGGVRPAAGSDANQKHLFWLATWSVGLEITLWGKRGWAAGSLLSALRQVHRGFARYALCVLYFSATGTALPPRDFRERP